MAPLYPLAFLVITFAYLGAPRTTRQSRTMSLPALSAVVALLRLIGFVSTVFGVNYPWMLGCSIVALAVAFVLGLYRDPPRPHHRAARLRRQLRNAALARAHQPAYRQPREETSRCSPEPSARYFGMRFLTAVCRVRRHVRADRAARLYRADAAHRRHPARLGGAGGEDRRSSACRQVTERIMPFCVLIGAMSCYLNLSRRLELVMARAAGMSAWQFIAPALIVALCLGVVATTRLQSDLGRLAGALQALRSRTVRREPRRIARRRHGFWVRQRDNAGQAIINAQTSRDQGAELSGVTVFTFDAAGHFAAAHRSAAPPCLKPGSGNSQDARVYALATHADRPAGLFAQDQPDAANRCAKALPRPKPCRSGSCRRISRIAEHAGLAAAGYRLQFQKLLARPFLLAAMVLLAAAVSLRFFRMGGVQKMVLGGVGRGLSALRLVEGHRRHEQGRLAAPRCGGMAAGVRWRTDRFHCAAVPGGRVMTGLRSTRPPMRRRLVRPWRGAGLRRRRPRAAGRRRHVCGRAGVGAEPEFPAAAGAEKIADRHRAAKSPGEKQMLVQATRDQLRLRQSSRHRGRQRADLLRRLHAARPTRSVYDQKTKRLHAEGNVRLTEAGRQGHLRRHHGTERRLSRRLRRFAAPRHAGSDAHRGARADRTERQLHRLAQRRLHRLRGRARTIRRSRRSGRSRRRASSTTKVRR